MIYGILSLALVNSLSLSIFVDMLKMQNSFFESPILPDARYFIDKYFNSSQAVNYFAVCPDCKRYIGKFNRSDRYIVCNHCHSNVSLKSPSYNDYFAMINVNNWWRQTLWVCSCKMIINIYSYRLVLLCCALSN